MMKRFTCCVAITAVAFALGLNGCSSADSDKSATPPAGQAANDNHDHAGREHNAADMEKAKAELAELPPPEKASAEKQHVCPVTGEMLGTMGPPKKVDVNGQQVWICCDGCREELQANPAKYLAKLKVAN
jgi:Cu(I)/Ag(I) efflux system membrane fusion protein